MGILARLIGKTDPPQHWTRKDWAAYREANYSPEELAAYNRRKRAVQRGVRR